MGEEHGYTVGRSSNMKAKRSSNMKAKKPVKRKAQAEETVTYQEGGARPINGSFNEIRMITQEFMSGSAESNLQPPSPPTGYASDDWYLLSVGILPDGRVGSVWYRWRAP